MGISARRSLETTPLTGLGLGDKCAILKPGSEVSNPQQEMHVYAFSLMAFVRITNPLTVES